MNDLFVLWLMLMIPITIYFIVIGIILNYIQDDIKKLLKRINGNDKEA